MMISTLICLPLPEDIAEINKYEHVRGGKLLRIVYHTAW